MAKKKSGPSKSALRGLSCDIGTVAANALQQFADVLHPQAICIRTPLPDRVPLDKCRLPAGVQTVVERYEPKVGKEGLFAHQAAFLTAFLHEGSNDFIITTATGSGKSLCFWTWVFECLRRDPNATALLCFPTQALMWGQAERMRRLSKSGSLISLKGKKTVCGGKIDLDGRDVGWTIWQGKGSGATYDAELDEYMKSDAFWRARIRIATLDKAHFSLFMGRQNKAFAARLRCFVLDEAHTYDGVFGANVHYFIRRLYLASNLQGSPRPHMFLASATLAAARQFAATLLSLDEGDITHIEDNIKQQIELIPTAEVPNGLADPRSGEMIRAVMLLDDPGGKSSVTDFLGDTDLIGKQVNAIYFSQSKFHSKLLKLRLAANEAGSARQVCIYDADLPPHKRRELEELLNSPTARGVTVLGTNALELGVDIEGLDLCLIDRTPPRRADLLQRIGRVGRRVGQPGLVVLRLSAEPHDRDMMEQPVDSFRLESNRALPIPLHLEMCKWRHMLAAFNEWAWELDSGRISSAEFGDAMEQHFGVATKRETLEKQFEDAYGSLIDTEVAFWVHKGFRASASEGKIPLKCGDVEIARIEDLAVFRDAHPGAVFLGHDLKHYRVVAYKGRWKVAQWENPESDTVLGKWLKDIQVIQVEPEPRAITTRGSWEEGFEFWEAGEPVDRHVRPRRGSFKFGVWNYNRCWQGYTEIDLESGKSRRVSLAEATQQFGAALKSGGNPPFLHEFSYRTVGWEWDFGRLEAGSRNAEELAVLSEGIGGLVAYFLATAVESKLEDLGIELDLSSHQLRVLDSTPGGNGLSEALLCDGRVATAFADCGRELKKYLGKGKKTKFQKYLRALRLDLPDVSPEEILDVIRELQVRWAG
jgi:superfamily II DNA/RNA helicase